MIEKINIENIPKDEVFINLNEFLIDPFETMQEPTPILSQITYNRYISIFTEDNVSMIQGKAKSRKSTLIKAISIAIMKGEFYMLKSNLQNQKLAIFDTEQGAYHCWKSANIISTLAGQKVDYFKLAGTTTEQKKNIVETYLKLNPECRFVFLDNIVHFLTDFNKADESAELNQWLIKTKSDYNTHICVVLHENGSDTGNGKAKGHIGTLLENTCETIIRVEKDKQDKSKSIVSAKAMRGIEFEPFTLEMDYQGVPYLSEYLETAPQSKTKRIIP